MSSAKDTNGPERTESVGAEVTPELKRRVRIAAARRGISQSEFIREVLRDATEGVE